MSKVPTSPMGDDPLIVGERRICRIRLVLYLVFIAYFSILNWLLGDIHAEKLTPMLAAGTVWFAFNLLLYAATSTKWFRSWMATASAFSDVTIVVLMNVATVGFSSLNYADNLFYSMYFVAIALSAIRKKVWVVNSVAGLAALAYLGISLYFQHALDINGFDTLWFKGKQVAAVALLDQLTKAFALALVGWIIGYVTAKIHAAQKNYATLFNNVPDGIVLTNATGTIETINQSFADMLQEPMPALVGRHVDTLFKSEYSKHHNNEAVIRRTTSTSVPVTIIESAVSQRKHATQKILSVRNMSVNEELREHISQAQKTEALGQIARGLAHDFNNLLGGILGAVSLIRSRLSRLPDAPEHVKLRRHAVVIQECTENARDILKGLLSLSRASSRSTSAFDPRKLLGELKAFVQKTFGDMYKVSLEINLSKALYIEGDENTIFQSLLNICLNARESMPNGGPIAIRIDESPPAEDDGLLPAYLQMAVDSRNVHFVQISIADKGQGMDKQTQQRCLEPFFSTKETSRRGTGLGLSISHTIIRHHNGALKISSAPARGTTVCIYLPCFYPEEQSS
ncbi:MAG: PAS domain-containing protein [Deltaproteobacteria bacterium]|nr:PAS domain-containing protein [Deltaproteobacteria bacterium]